MRNILLISVLCSLLILPALAFPETATVGSTRIHPLASGGTEYRVDLGRGVKSFAVQLRGSYDFRLAFTEGGTATSYITIRAGSTYYSPLIAWAGVFYVRCEEDAQILEIEYWK